MDGKATIINCNTNAHSIVSAAGRISTTKGSADEIYKASEANAEEVNVKLIHKILSSGHESVLEHVFVNLSFDNVSVFTEQFMIEFRLASFTVKSRRYVDFGEMGYKVPDFSRYSCEESMQLEQMYRRHMDFLFAEYKEFVEAGIPKEDARFVLPYSFKSNFYCTVNARELKKIITEMIYGRGSALPELVELGNSLLKQCEEVLPYLNIKKEETEEKTGSLNSGKPKNRAESEELVTFLCGTKEPEQLLCQAAAFAAGMPMDVKLKEAEQKEVIRSLMRGRRKRELEQVNFTFIFQKISLAGVTHLVRHRMQSIVIPAYLDVCSYEHYVVPERIVQNGLEERYRAVFQKSKEVAAALKEKGFDGQESVYLLLSGMTIPVMTTMNANELYIFMKLRTCNRAQWEIKACADALLRILREKYPILFSLYGPSCYADGRCPEGRMTCGKIREVCQNYEAQCGKSFKNGN